MVRIEDDGSRILEGSSEMNRQEKSFTDNSGEGRFRETKLGQQDGSHIIIDGDPMERSSLIRTNMATQNFSSQERLIFAITDDDVSTFDKLEIPLVELVMMRFEGGTNILNFAIE